MAEGGESQSASNSRKRLFGVSSQNFSGGTQQYAANFPSKFEALAKELTFLKIDLLDGTMKKRVQSIVFVAKQLVAQNKITNITLGKIVRKYSDLPLEFLWMLQTAEILNFSLYVATHSNLDLVAIAGRIAKFLDSSKEVPNGNIAVGIAIDFLRTNIILVHGPDPPKNLNPVRKSCRTLLSHILKNVVFPLDDEASPAPWWLTQLSKDLSTEIFKNFAESLLDIQLTAPPFISVHQALARQSEWKVGRQSFNLVFKICGSSTAALNVLIKILNDTKEVNWKAVLISISSFLHLFPDSREKLIDLVSAWLAQSFSSEDNETLLLSFILARQLAYATPPYPYAHWFKKTFGHRQTTLCKSRNQFQFLLDFLTQLVPHETAACLKTHHDFPPYVPPVIKDKLQDYLMLASTRLKDLNQTNEIVGVFQAENIKINSIAEQVQYDIERAIAHFEVTRKLHENIRTSAIFKKKYFESQFIPAVLVPREGIRTNDSQTMFVDMLLKAKKITAVQHETFQAMALERM